MSIVPHKLWLTAAMITVSCSASALSTASLEKAIAEAERLGKAPPGQSYQYNALAALGPALANAMAGCYAASKQEKPYDLVFIISADGHVQDVVYTPRNAVAACVARKMKGLTVPPPPRASWPVYLQGASLPSR